MEEVNLFGTEEETKQLQELKKNIYTAKIQALKELGYTVKYDPGDDRCMSPDDRTYISW